MATEDREKLINKITFAWATADDIRNEERSWLLLLLLLLLGAATCKLFIECVDVDAVKKKRNIYI